jgi:hypothetical protein
MDLREMTNCVCTVYMGSDIKFRRAFSAVIVAVLPFDVKYRGSIIVGRIPWCGERPQRVQLA